MAQTRGVVTLPSTKHTEPPPPCRVRLISTSAACPRTAGVTLVLRWCYAGVTLVLRRCYAGVTLVLRWCYAGVTLVVRDSERALSASLPLLAQEDP
eukprot:2310893-Pyramimonas_sp.AAC.1